MDGSGSRLTEFLLDLTEDEKLSRAFKNNAPSVISSRGLGRHEKLILSGDVAQLRKAVRAELAGQPVPDLVKGVMSPPDKEPDPIIAGVRIPGVRTSEEPTPGVMEPGPPDEGIRGVMEPGPPGEGIRGVMEPGPPDEGIRGVMEPGPPESA
jgi:hypothetical protein